MSAWIRRSRRGTALFATAFFCALLLRALVPSGFMPTASGERLTVTLCSSAHGKSVTLDTEGKASDRAHESATGPCAFAAGLGQAVVGTAELSEFGPAFFGSILIASAVPADLNVRRLAAPPPPSQAPPPLV